MKKDMFVKFLNRLFGDEDHHLDGVSVDDTATLATDGRVLLWSTQGSEAGRLTDEQQPKVLSVTKKQMTGEVLATTAISAYNLWLLGKTLGNKESADEVVIQLRTWGESAILLAATKNNGMLIMPLRTHPSPDTAPFLFWGLDGDDTP